jgi:hypothetical protein
MRHDNGYTKVNAAGFRWLISRRAWEGQYRVWPQQRFTYLGRMDNIKVGYRCCGDALPFPTAEERDFFVRHALPQEFASR